MTDVPMSSSDALSARFRRAQRLLGVATILVGVSVLVGWVIAADGFTRWWGPADSRPLSALGFALGGAALASTQSRPSESALAQRSFAVLASVIGVAVLVEWMVHPLGTIDQWLQDAHGGVGFSTRPAAHVALALVLFGIAHASFGARPQSASRG